MGLRSLTPPPSAHNRVVRGWGLQPWSRVTSEHFHTHCRDRRSVRGQVLLPGKSLQGVGVCVCAHPLGGAGSLQVSLTLLCGFGQVFFPLWATGSPWMGGEAGAGVSKGSSGSSGSAARGCQTSRARPAGQGSESLPRRPDHLRMQIPSLHPTLHTPDGLVQGNSC